MKLTQDNGRDAHGPPDEDHMGHMNEHRVKTHIGRIHNLKSLGYLFTVIYCALLRLYRKQIYHFFHFHGKPIGGTTAIFNVCIELRVAYCISKAYHYHKWQSNA